MQKIYLDISNKGVIPCIQAKQSEVGRKFLAVITDNGVPYNIPDNSLLSVWYEGDTDAGNYSSIDEKSAFEIDGNKVSVELVAQMLLKPGKGDLCLSITHGDGGETNTWNIPYDVEYKPGAGSSVATEYYTALTEAGAKAAEQVDIATSEADRARDEADRAADIAFGLLKKDITEKISFSVDENQIPSTITSHKITLRRAEYSPVSGVVHFDALLQFSGTMASGDTIVLKRTGLYEPTNQVAISCASTTTWGYFTAFMNADGTIKVTANENMDIGTSICLTGWYFCDGEQSV